MAIFFAESHPAGYAVAKVKAVGESPLLDELYPGGVQYMIDGGMVANNPSTVAVLFATKAFANNQQRVPLEV